jgi:hypothetical protein
MRKRREILQLAASARDRAAPDRRREGGHRGPVLCGGAGYGGFWGDGYFRHGWNSVVPPLASGGRIRAQDIVWIDAGVLSPPEQTPGGRSEPDHESGLGRRAGQGSAWSGWSCFLLGERFRRALSSRGEVQILLVHLRRDAIKHSALGADDGPPGCGPLERRRVVIPCAQESSEMVAQRLLGAEVREVEGWFGRTAKTSPRPDQQPEFATQPEYSLSHSPPSPVVSW